MKMNGNDISILNADAIGRELRAGTTIRAGSPRHVIHLYWEVIMVGGDTNRNDFVPRHVYVVEKSWTNGGALLEKHHFNHAREAVEMFIAWRNGLAVDIALKALGLPNGEDPTTEGQR